MNEVPTRHIMKETRPSREIPVPERDLPEGTQLLNEKYRGGLGNPGSRVDMGGSEGGKGGGHGGSGRGGGGMGGGRGGGSGGRTSTSNNGGMTDEMRAMSEPSILWIIVLLLPVLVKAEVKEIPFTLDDRDRIIRVEQQIVALDAKIDIRMDSLHSEMDARFTQLFNFLWAIIGIFTTMMISVFGFAFWDRKLSLAPLKKQDQKIHENTFNL